MHRVRALFRWAAGEELYPGESLASLKRRERQLKVNVEGFADSARRAMGGLRSRAIDAGEVDPDWSVVDGLKGATKKLRIALERGPEEQYG